MLIMLLAILMSVVTTLIDLLLPEHSKQYELVDQGAVPWFEILSGTEFTCPRYVFRDKGWLFDACIRSGDHLTNPVS